MRINCYHPPGLSEHGVPETKEMTHVKTRRVRLAAGGVSVTRRYRCSGCGHKVEVPTQGREKILRDAVEIAVDKPDYTNPELIIEKLREAIEQVDAVNGGHEEEPGTVINRLRMAIEGLRKTRVPGGKNCWCIPQGMDGPTDHTDSCKKAKEAMGEK